MCAVELPNFQHISDKATATQLRLISDQDVPSANDTKTHSKAWTGQLTTGPFFLFLDEMTGAKGTATSCGVVGDVPDLDTFLTESVQSLELASAPQPELGGDGSRSFVWQGPYGRQSMLILRDFKPIGKRGAMLKLVNMVASH